MSISSRVIRNHLRTRRFLWTAPLLALVVLTLEPRQTIAAEQGALGSDRMTQAKLTDGTLSLEQLRAAGLRMFVTPLNRHDGYGDGPVNPTDTLFPGGRPTLAGNGTFLRVNGLDGQSCNECHSIVSAATFPPRLGIGGVGGSVTNALIGPTFIDPGALLSGDDKAGFNGRIGNPPFIFGAGGVELLGLEMTADLRAAVATARATPGTEITLETKGVEFGSIVAAENGSIDTSSVEGIDKDLIVRPFGRKGEFDTTRQFDIGAMRFHFGMEPVEVVGEDVDADGDGVTNEVLAGELSALHVFVSTAVRPRQTRRSPAAAAGFESFKTIGCASCHIPALETRGRYLPLRFPEDASDPTANTYYNVDLQAAPPNFERSPGGGLVIPLFADLKRHDMGETLAEEAHFASEAVNREFTTARLWGVADTAPYLHDGRATTLTDAILLHGGDAQAARDAFDELDQGKRDQLIEFLRTLRTPRAGIRVDIPRDAKKR
jgi:hypothetical protein